MEAPTRGTPQRKTCHASVSMRPRERPSNSSPAKAIYAGQKHIVQAFYARVAQLGERATDKFQFGAILWEMPGVRPFADDVTKWEANEEGDVEGCSLRGVPLLQLVPDREECSRLHRVLRGLVLDAVQDARAEVADEGSDDDDEAPAEPPAPVPATPTPREASPEPTPRTDVPQPSPRRAATKSKKHTEASPKRPAPALREGTPRAVPPLPDRSSDAGRTGAARGTRSRGPLEADANPSEPEAPVAPAAPRKRRGGGSAGSGKPSKRKPTWN